MWKWLKGPGKVFRTTPAGSTNYLSAYDREGNLLRAKRGAEKVRNADIEDEDVAAERDLSTTELTEEEREQKKEERALRRAEYEEIEARGGVPKERQSDLRPYPLNQNFRSQPVLCEELREQVYYLAVHQGFDLSSLAATFQMDVRRVAAVVRLKTIEKKWVAEVSNLYFFLRFIALLHPFVLMISIPNSISLEDYLHGYTYFALRASLKFTACTL